jgi:hypothetical protein
MIKGSDLRYIQVACDNVRCAVGKAQASAGKLLKENPTSIELILGNLVQEYLRTNNDEIAELDGFGSFTAHQEQSKGLVNDIIACDNWLIERSEPLDTSQVAWVSCYQ